VQSGALLANDSQLGRSTTEMAISRLSLMEEMTARGIRITKQRRLLVGIIQDSPRHLDAFSLLKVAKLSDSNINLATVYRTLALLKGRGLIDELDLLHLEGEKHYYEAKTSSDHCHIACFNCGAILEYSNPLFERLKKKIASDSGFLIRVARLELGGVCSRCASAR
jgi:Fur family ferric uptake transcriptional regulator